MNNFDVLVIGGGPGGYVAAIRAAQLGFNTACVDDFVKDGKYSLGGTCLNVGCIPSKALLQSSENYAELLHSFADHGISCDNPQIDIAKMLARKDGIIGKNASGISFLFKKNKITELHGVASFTARSDSSAAQWVININDNGNITQVSATHIILATGSSPRALSQIAVDNKNILDNAGALSLTAAPQELCIIGAGVIGLEMGSVWKRLGSNVTILEAMDSFLGAADLQVATELQKQLKKQGLVIKTGVKIGAISNDSDLVTVKYSDAAGEQELICDKLIVAIGRVPNTSGLNADAVGLKIDERGMIVVDESCRTNLANVWAVGDCVRGPMLAHKASDEGVCVAERIAGQHPHFDFNTVPWVIYTNPEMAWVGKTEKQLQDAGVAYKKGVANFMSNGRALGLGNSIGFVKILASEDTDRILGVHMVGPFVSELISEAVVAMEFMASSEDLARIIHAHPSLSEVTHEAALACDKRQLHG
jgi:dihydrolipoamide dehydrogenase